jgi:hypothetical protein
MKKLDAQLLPTVAVAMGFLFACSLGMPGAAAWGASKAHRHYHVAVGQIAPPTIEVSNDMSSATAVFLGGTPIMRFRVAAGGYTPEERADKTQQRLNTLLGEGPIYPSDITVAMQGDDALVLVKGQLLFTADTETAAYNQSTPLELANMWAARMRSVLPELTAPH